MTPLSASELEVAPRSLAEQAYQLLAVMITRLKLVPGQIVNERALMNELNIGRTPVREALHKLVGEGLIVHLPNRGMFVADINASTVKHIYEFRSLIEIETARMAATRASQTNIADLKAVSARMLAAAQARDVDLYVELDRTFYTVLVAAAENGFLRDVVNSIFNHHLRLWFYIASKTGGWEPIMNAHVKMVQDVTCGVAERDPDRAAMAIETYISERYADAMTVI